MSEYKVESPFALLRVTKSWMYRPVVCLETSVFSLKRLSSGQYLHKKKNLKIQVHTVQNCHEPAFFKLCFCKYWPADGLLGRN
jgi:hypothetical protein